MDLASRAALAQKLLTDEATAKAIAGAFYARHPDWTQRFGDAGKQRSIEDARFHVSFLAGAVQAGTAAVFADYVRWCGSVLAARGIAPEHLAEYLELLREHLSLVGDERALVDELIFAGVAALASPPHAAPEPSRTAYLAAAIAGDRAAAWEAVRDARKERSVAEVYRDVLIATQRRLGELWAAREITVAQEHMASAVTQSILPRLYAEIAVERRAGRALVAGVENELHVLPAQLAADLLELEGWDVAFVGTHVPLHDIIAAIESEKPDVVGLSATILFNLPQTIALARAVRERFATLPIVLGGRAARGVVGLAEELRVTCDERGDLAPFRAYARG